MAHDANAVVEGKLQQQLAAAQDKLLAEQQRRVDAEGEAKVRPAGCTAIDKAAASFVLRNAHWIPRRLR